jgi:hypothetical protein
MSAESPKFARGASLVVCLQQRPLFMRHPPRKPGRVALFPADPAKRGAQDADRTSTLPCSARKQVRAPMPPQPSTVVDDDSCEIGEQQGA